MRTRHTNASVHMAPVHVWETIPGVILTQETAVSLGHTFSNLQDAAKCSQTSPYRVPSSKAGNEVAVSS